MAGLYLHIPFCKQACSYCDFYFTVKRRNVDEVVEAICSEIRSYAQSPFASTEMNTVYFGGGTPSQLRSAELEKIVLALRSVFTIHANAEWSIELNPDDVTRDYVYELTELGFNRASMGVQSFNPQLLTFMHRAHDAQQALACLEILKKSSFDTFTCDLIYGNPAQSLKALEKDVQTLLQFEPPHVSAYALTIEHETRLGKLLDLGRLEAVEDDVVAEHSDLVVDMLQDAGILRYEVSNFALPGHESRHNSAYWRHENYLGMGPSAHSFWWNEGDVTAARWANAKSLNWLHESSMKEHLNLFTLAEERLLIALRTTQGIALSDLEKRYQYVFSEQQRQYLSILQEKHLLRLDEHIQLTRDGMKLADAITLNLITKR